MKEAVVLGLAWFAILSYFIGWTWAITLAYVSGGGFVAALVAAMGTSISVMLWQYLDNYSN